MTETESLTRAQLARILRAYIGRLTLADLHKLVECQESAWYAAMNLGNSSQLAAFVQTNDACRAAVDNMIEHDCGLISDVIRTVASEA